MPSHVECDFFIHLRGFGPVAENDTDAACGGEAENLVIIEAFLPMIAPQMH